MLMNFPDIISNKYIQMILNSEFFEVWRLIAISIGIFVLILFLKNVVTKYIIKILTKIFNKLKIKGAAVILKCFEEPIKILLVAIGAYTIAVMFCNEFGLLNFKPVINKIFSSTVIILITMGLVNTVSHADGLLEKATSRYNIKVNTVLIPTLRKVIKVLIYLFAVIQISNLWGLDVNGFIAGLGLSGVVVALAAKDYASNMMSGVIIFLDNPFTMGDWIKCGDLEGTVEDISFRSTKIRTVDKVLISVPNSVLANGSIYNYNKRDFRRVTMSIGVTYDTTHEQIEKCCSRITEMLNKSKSVDTDGILVKFDNFGESSLNINIYFFAEGITFAEYMTVKEEVNYKIMDILKEEGVEMAFPTRTVVISK